MGLLRPPANHIRTLLLVSGAALVYQLLTFALKVGAGQPLEAGLALLGTGLSAAFLLSTLRHRRQPAGLTRLIVPFIGLWFVRYVVAGVLSDAPLDVDVYTTLLILVALAFSLLRLRSAALLAAGCFALVTLLALTRRSYDAELLTDVGFVALLFAYSSSYGHRVLRARERAELLRVFAEKDMLTDLLNRRTVQDRIERLMAAAPGERAGAAILLLDLDDFKTLNDTLGHQAGDRTLVEVAHFLRTQAGPDDLVCRWGGEEFVLLLGATTRREVEGRVAALVRGIRHWPTLEPAVTLSAGAAMLDEGETAREVIHLADRRMYEAKRQGKNRFVVGGCPGLA